MRTLSKLSPMLVFLLNSCANQVSDPVRVENDFGESVRKMQASQIYSKRALGNTRNKKIFLLDGAVADTNVESYRKNPP